MRYSLLFFLVLLLIGCSDDDTVSNRRIFSMDYNADSIDPVTGVWIVLRDDETGELIEARELVNGLNSFESTKRIKSGKLTVTHFIASSGAYMRVYSDVEVGSEWSNGIDRYQQSDPQSPSLSGEYYLTITNVPALYAFTITDKYGFKNHIDANYENGTVKIFSDFSNGEKQLITIDPQVGKQKYAYVEDLHVGKIVTLDYSDFKEFDSYLHLPYEGTKEEIAYAAGYTTAKYYNGYDTYRLYYGGTYAPNDFVKKDMNIGILKDLPIYRIWLYNGFSEYQYYGPVPHSVERKSSEVWVTDPSFKNFSITGTGRYNYSRIAFSHISEGSGDPSIYVEIYSQEGDLKFSDPLTDEMESTYHLKMDDLKYSTMEIMSGTRTLKDAINMTYRSDFDFTKAYESWRLFVSKDF